jgi:tetratricopeptide (TPR) repeat protein
MWALIESAARQFPLDIEKMAAAYWEKRDLERAGPVFRLMVDCFDGYAEVHNYLGLIALERGQLDAAIASFQKTMELGRRLFPSRISRKCWWSDRRTRPYMRGMQNLASALSRAGRWDEAPDRSRGEPGGGARPLRGGTPARSPGPVPPWRAQRPARGAAPARHAVPRSSLAR